MTAKPGDLVSVPSVTVPDRRPLFSKHELLERLAARKPHTRRVTIALDDDARQAVVDAQAAVVKAEADSKKPAITAARRKLEQAQTAVAAASVSLTVQHISGPAYNALLDEHPPTARNEDDGQPYNPTTFAPALVRACLAEPQLSDGEFAELWEQLSNPEATVLFTAALIVNGQSDHITMKSA
jgi:hypothetical protein